MFKRNQCFHLQKDNLICYFFVISNKVRNMGNKQLLQWLNSFLTSKQPH